MTKGVRFPTSPMRNFLFLSNVFGFFNGNLRLHHQWVFRLHHQGTSYLTGYGDKDERSKIHFCSNNDKGNMPSKW